MFFKHRPFFLDVAMRILLLTLSLFFVSCATHAPLSELVMFNKHDGYRGAPYGNGLGASYLESGSEKSDFEQKT